MSQRTKSPHHTLKDQLSAAMQKEPELTTQPAKTPYKEPSLSQERHLSLLESRGLVVPDKQRALHYLTFIGYFRLSGYASRFRKNSSDDFISGTTFDDVFNLYKFDRKLRILILDVIKRVEIATRTVISNHMSNKYGPHWFMDASLFINEEKHESILSDIKKCIDKNSRESLIENYYLKHCSPEFPPSWILCEVTTFGLWSKIFSYLKNKEDKNEISQFFNQKSQVIESFLHCLTSLRNTCAHHGRVWDRIFGVKPIKHKRYPEIFIRNDRLYAQLAVLNLLTNVIASGSSWKERLDRLFSSNPSLRLSLMGFPDGWKDLPFWGTGKA